MKIGILGAGKIAVKMTKTVNAMKANGEDVCVYAIASRNLEKAEEFAQQYGVQCAYGSYEDMLKDPQVDLVYIATPHSHHYEHALLCIQNKKPVLCEKAFTANAKQAEKLLKLAAEQGVFITEAIWPRYMPSRGIISSILESGKLGEVKMLTANLGYTISDVPRIYEPELCGGALLDVGIYALTFASMYFGNDYAQIEGSCVSMPTGVDGQDSITLKYKDGRMSQLMANVYFRSDRRGIIYGTKGYLEVEDVNNPQFAHLYLEENNYVPERIDFPTRLTGYEYEVRACMKALKEGALECPEMPHTEIITIMKTMDELRRQFGVHYSYDEIDY